MKKVVAIVGPTASGKTAFSILLAKAIDAEIISGDSIQVYCGFDIGSGKVSLQDRSLVKHHLIDIKEARDTYSVKEFQERARNIIDYTDKPIILCGGTGLYLKAALYDYDFPKEEIKYFDYSTFSNDELYQRLKKLDPNQCAKIHPHNRQRLERSLTIYEQSGIPQSTLIARQEKKEIYDVYWIGISWQREDLYKRINMRVEKMLVDGLEDEVNSLLQHGSKFSDQAMKGIGYREWQEYFNGHQSLEQTKYLIQRNSRHFAKRQLTWFNNQVEVDWILPNDLMSKVNDIKAWLKNKK